MKHVVGFSGGIDSQAAALWVRKKFPAEDIILLNSNAGGNEHPFTEEFVAWYSANIFPVITVKPLIRDLGNRGTKEGDTKKRRQQYKDEDEMTFPILSYIKGRWPSRKVQFCTEHLKLLPQRRWCDENLKSAGIDYVRYTGVRQDESHRRKDTPEVAFDEFFMCKVYHPVSTWTKQQCFDFVLQNGERINPLYTMGFGRVGCAPCINSSKDDIRNWAARFPEMIDKIREWEMFTRRTFFAPMVPGKQTNSIDDVVAWSKTSRGGKMLELPYLEIEASEGGCSSRYTGLCE